jgi:WD40 repeat protein
MKRKRNMEEALEKKIPSFFQENKILIIFGAITLLFTLLNVTIIIVIILNQHSDVIQTFSGHLAKIGRLVELSNGQLASISRDNTVRIWNRTTGNNESILDHRHYDIANFVAFQGGNLAATKIDYPYDIEIFNPYTGNVL